MICPFCNKYEATIHLTQINNGKIQEIHICEFCAKDKGLLSSQLVDFSELIAGMAADGDFGAAPHDAPMDAPDKLAALMHDMIEGDAASAKAMLAFHKTGRFSSPGDYDLLQKQLLPLLEKIHGATRHTGKTPKSHPRQFSIDEQIADLKAKLDAAVREEHFEKAAGLRDRIRELEAQRLPQSDGEKNAQAKQSE